MMNPENIPATGLVPRPPFQLRSLPIEFRWEATRRHPYYQIFWRNAQANHRQESLSSHPAELLLRQAGTVALRMIGVVGEPPNPATAFSELDERELKDAWLSGAVHPMTFRGFAAILLAALPKETLGQLGLLFLEAARDETEDGLSRKLESMMNLQNERSEGLDNFPDEPFVSINPAASGRQVSEAVTELLKEWKDERKLSEQRHRSDKYREYLDVWDSREGWNGSGYDLTQEQTYQSIASETEKDVPTVSNHYRAAFKLIIGHEYSPELWWRTMGAEKSIRFDLVDSVVSKNRPTKSPTRRPVPETKLGADIESVRQLTLNDSNQYSPEDLSLDIRQLIAEEKSDAEIIQMLGLQDKEAEALNCIAWYRDRCQES